MAHVWDLQGKDLEKFERVLKRFASTDYPKVNGAALNTIAYEVMGKSHQIAKQRFMMRNKFTVKSIQFQKVRGFNPGSQFSSVGSTMDYMEDQEFGKNKTKTGKKGVAIPTTTASNESFSTRPRRKLVTRSRRRTNINLMKSTVRTKSRKQHIIGIIREKRSGRRFAYLPIQNAPGIYMITGKGKRAKIFLIYDLSRSSVTIKKAPWLLPAVNYIRPRMPLIYVRTAEKILKKSFL